MKEKKEKKEKKKKETLNVPDTSPDPASEAPKRSPSRAKSISRYRNIQYTGMREKGSGRKSEAQGVAATRGRPDARSSRT